jgi:hypothetical protein
LSNVADYSIPLERAETGGSALRGLATVVATALKSYLVLADG